MDALTLRPYQQEAVDKIIWSLKLDGNDLCVLPTGSGKSVVIAHLAKQLDQPILILQPGKEILEQNRNKLALYVEPDRIGTYSASMNEKTIRQYTFATIQSVYTKPEDFKHFKLVLIDECHLVNPKSLGGMFTSFLKGIGSPKVVGFTATPYRMDLGYRRRGEDFEAFTTIKLINRMKNHFWTRLMFNVNNSELLAAGYLSPLKYYVDKNLDHAEIPLNRSQSDFDLLGYEKILSKKSVNILKGIEWAKKECKSILVFCSSVRQAEELSRLVEYSACVSAKTKPAARANIIEQFKNGGLQVVFNMGVLTTGFDHPALDCIFLARPTRSIALYYQMLGRGVRLAPGKDHCKVIDLSGTVTHLGRIESLQLKKDPSGKWDLYSERGQWHGRELYSFIVKPK